MLTAILIFNFAEFQQVNPGGISDSNMFQRQSVGIEKTTDSTLGENRGIKEGNTRKRTAGNSTILFRAVCAG
jgi:hypothetical protein